MNFHHEPINEFFILFSANSPIPPLKEELLNEDIELYKGEWKKAKMGEVAKNIQSWNIVSLLVGSNDETKILKHIGDILFPYLQKIDVRHNNIESIESFNKIWLSELKQLVLSQNNIATISQLANNTSTSYPNLKNLRLKNNPISDAFKFQKMNSKKLLQFYFEGRSVKEIQNISFLFKMSAQKMKKIKFEEKWMVSQNNYIQVLKKKYKNIGIIKSKPTNRDFF